MDSTGYTIVDGTTGIDGYLEARLDLGAIDPRAEYRLIVAGHDAGSAHAIRKLQAARRSAGDAQNAEPSARQEPPVNAGGDIPKSVEAIRESKKRVIARLIEFGRVTDDEAVDIVTGMSVLLQSQLPARNTMIWHQTLGRLKARHVTPLMENGEAVLMGGLTEYALELYFQNIEIASCGEAFEAPMSVCDAVIAAATRVRGPAPSALADPSVLVDALHDAGIDELRAQALVEALNATMRGAHLTSTDSGRGAVLYTFVQHCPIRNGAMGNLRAWQLGATPKLARCLAQAAEGRVDILRDVFFPELPLPVVRDFASWAER
jgi:hypothetical protein